MHRSGTSALTRTLSLLGAELPTHLLGHDGSGAASNRLGHWEPEKVVELNDAALLAAGIDWRNAAGVPEEWFASAEASGFRARAVDLLAREYGTAPLFVMKDPRTCLLGPMWLGALRDAGITPAPVLVYRSAAEVAASLHKRNEMDPVLGELLWLRYVLEAERATRGMRRVHLSYQALLDDWQATVARVGDALGLDWPIAPDAAAGEIDAYVSPSERHHVIAHAAPSLPWVREVEALVTGWSAADEATGDTATLDDVYRMFDGATKGLSAPLRVAFTQSAIAAKLRKARNKSEAEAGQLRSERVALEAQAEALETRLAESADRTQQQAVALAEARTVAELGQREWAARIEGLESLVEVHARNAGDAAARAESFERSYREQQRVVAEAVEQSARLAAQAEGGQMLLAERGRRLDELERSIATERELRARAEALADEQREQLQAMARAEARLMMLEAELERFQQERVEVRQQLEAGFQARRKLEIQLADAETTTRGEVKALESQLAKALALAKQRQAAIEHLRSDRAAALAKRDKRIEELLAALQAVETTRPAPRASGKSRPLLHRLARLRDKLLGGNRARDAAQRELVATSGLFDAAYYLRRYPDVAAEGIDPLDHYMRHGAREGRAPSERFNGAHYLEANPDVGEAGVNPLVHYIEHGRAEGRSPLPERIVSTLPRPFSSPVAGIAAPLSAPKPVSGGAKPSHRGDKPASASVAAPVSYSPWRGRPVRFAEVADAIAPWRATADLPTAHGIVAGNAVIAVEPDEDRPAGRASLEWLAYLNGAGQRPPGDAADAVRTSLCNDAVILDDAWFVADHALQLRFRCTAKPAGDRHFGVRLFQAGGDDGLVIVGEAVFATTGLRLVGATLANPFCPILVVVTDDTGVYHDCLLIAFPSLCRNGAHFAELGFGGADTTPVRALRQYSADLLNRIDREAGFAVSDIAIHLGGATGSEPIFGMAMGAWLAGLGVAIAAEGAPSDMPAAARDALATQLEEARDVGNPSLPLRPKASTLVLPPDAVPALTALFGPAGVGAADQAVTMLAVGALSAEPLHALSVPASYAPVPDDAARLALGYLRSADTAVAGIGAAPLALCPAVPLAAKDPRRLFPVPMDMAHPLVKAEAATAPVSVAIDCDGAEAGSIDGCVQALIAQTGIGDLEIILLGGDAGTIASDVAAAGVRVVAMAGTSGNPIAARLDAARAATANLLVFLHHAVVLNDRRTLAGLASIADLPDAFSAGCVLASDLVGPRGAQIHRRVAGHVTLAREPNRVGEVDISTASLPLLFPVVAHSLRCCLVRRDRWIECASEIEGTVVDLTALELAIGLGAIAAGHRNLSTASLVAFDAAADPAIATAAAMPPPGVTAVREFRR
ncbi:sulfotransferase family protein [Sphingomonas sp. RS6]